MGGVRFVLADQPEGVSRAALELQGDTHAKTHPVRDRRRPDHAGTGAARAPVAQVTLHARARRRITAVARRLALPFQLAPARAGRGAPGGDRKSTRLNSSHPVITYAVF